VTELIFNLALLLFVFVIVVTVTVGSLHRRRADRRRQDDERSLILQAFVGAATRPTTPSTPHPTAPSDVPPAAAVPTAAGQRHQLDVESVAALLDLLEGRQPARRGLVSGLIASPRTIWSAGETAGRQAGQRTMAGLGSRSATTSAFSFTAKPPPNWSRFTAKTLAMPMSSTSVTPPLSVTRSWPSSTSAQPPTPLIPTTPATSPPSWMRSPAPFSPRKCRMPVTSSSRKYGLPPEWGHRHSPPA
jgi:hypothetical protein